MEDLILDPRLLITEALFLALLWFVKAKMHSYDRKHSEHDESIQDLQSSHAREIQRLSDHIDEDREQFKRIEDLLKEQRDDTKTLLRLVGRGGV